MLRKIFAMCALLISYSASAEFVSVYFHVENDEGIPVNGAKIVVSTEKEETNLSWLGKIRMSKYVETTDRHGDAVCRFSCYSGDFRVKVSADGYYLTEFSDLHFDVDEDKLSAGKMVFLQKKRDLRICLRRIKSPVVMNVFKFPVWNIPSASGMFGFDCEVGDWVRPHGLGKIADITIQYRLDISNGHEKCEGKFVFNNGGAYKRKKFNSSMGLLSEYCADTNADYVAEYPFSSFCNLSDGSGHGSMRVANEEDYLVFRTRVVKDEKGQIVSSNYGKIYGPIRILGVMKFDGLFFNPAINNPNIEEAR